MRDVIRHERGGLFLCYKVTGDLEKMYKYYSSLSAWQIYEYLAIVKTQEFLRESVEDGE